MFERMYPQELHQEGEEVEDTIGDDDEGPSATEEDLSDPDFVLDYLTRAGSKLDTLDAALPNVAYDGEWV